MANIEVGAYFYPMTRKDVERQKRARQAGVNLADETLLVQSAEPLFPEHGQPRTYCLGDSSITTWDDADPAAVARQAEMAITHGIRFWIFNIYDGLINGNGRPVRELFGPIDGAFLKVKESNGMKFATMAVLGRPRIILPMPRIKDFEEPERYYKLSSGTARLLVDDNAQKYWWRHNYLHIKGRPYLSLLLPYRQEVAEHKNNAQELTRFVEEMREHAQRKYKVNPYIVGVIVGYKTMMMSADNFAKARVDALTGYAFLPEFGHLQPPIQEYKPLVERRKFDWKTIKDKFGLPFIPPAVVGWDASPRGERGYRNKLSEVKGYYPWHPIVVGNTPEGFRQMLADSLEFIDNNVPKGEQIGIVCSQTEIGEGHALTPPKRADNTVDFGYLEAVRDVTEARKREGDLFSRKLVNRSG